MSKHARAASYVRQAGKINDSEKQARGLESLSNCGCSLGELSLCGGPVLSHVCGHWQLHWQLLTKVTLCLENCKALDQTSPLLYHARNKKP